MQLTDVEEYLESPFAECVQGKGEFTMEYARHAAITADKQAELTATYKSSR